MSNIAILTRAVSMIERQQAALARSSESLTKALQLAISKADGGKPVKATAKAAPVKAGKVAAKPVKAVKGAKPVKATRKARVSEDDFPEE